METVCMKMSTIARFALLTSISILPAYVMAANDNFTSKLVNQSKLNDSEGYYLVQDKILGENDCVKVDGNKKLNPGDSAQLNIKKECNWGVVRYKIFSVKDNKDMGYLGHSFHDGNFSIDVTSVCKGSECSFYGLNPEQNRNK